MYSEALLKQTARDCQNLFVISRVCNNRDNNGLKQAEPNQYITIICLLLPEDRYNQVFYNRVSLYVIEIDLFT